MFSEIGARRRRMRAALGDRGQSLFGFLVMSGLAVGSLGLLIQPWMAAAAPWGFALPVLYALGMVLIEWRRQAFLARVAATEEAPDEDESPTGVGYDWLVALWSLACALAGLAAFMIALRAEPAPPAEDVWTPPASVVDSTLSGPENSGP